VKHVLAGVNGCVVAGTVVQHQRSGLGIQKGLWDRSACTSMILRFEVDDLYDSVLLAVQAQR
jgi:hypothetical protein